MGVTKRIYEHEIRDILKMWSDQIKTIIPVLPQFYREDDIKGLLKTYYPHEWHSVEIKYDYYNKKDQYLKRRFGKPRFCMKRADILLKDVRLYSQICSEEYKNKYSNNFSESNRQKAEKTLQAKRTPKIDKVNKKIETALKKTQQMTPAFLEQLIGLYERKDTTQKDRCYILQELKKYYNQRVIHFFFKLNDTELNKQLRWEAFYHLQSFNYQPRARRQKYMQVHTSNKKRKHYLKYDYPNETYKIPHTPYELEYRINNSKEQKLKYYDYFISHSSKDSKSVQRLIEFENNANKNVFCDWINDVDYLKRNLICEATLRVIEERLKQSKALLYVDSENASESVWCIYELNYFLELDKPIYTIKKQDIDNDSFYITPLVDKWFIDQDYKKLPLIKV